MKGLKYVIPHLIRAGLIARTGKKRSRRYVVSDAAREIIAEDRDETLPLTGKMADAVLNALTPYAKAGVLADYDKLAADLGVKVSTIQAHISRLVGAGRLFRLGSSHSRRFTFTPPAGWEPREDIRPLSKEQLMRGRA